MTRLLILRPEPGAGATAGRARELGFEVITVPLFRIEPADWTGPDPQTFDGLLLTSANAVRFGGDHVQRYRGLEVYAVGEATATAARDLGFDLAATGEAGVDRLLGSINPELRLLHLCGEDRWKARSARQKITELVVYRSKAIEHPDLSAAVGSLALIHSPRTARRFAELVKDRSSTRIIAISAAAAEPLGTGWQSVTVSKQPSDEALLALAASLCKNVPQG